MGKKSFCCCLALWPLLASSLPLGKAEKGEDKRLQLKASLPRHLKWYLLILDLKSSSQRTASMLKEAVNFVSIHEVVLAF